jgi:collagenase-like PrtC family protease
MLKKYGFNLYGDLRLNVTNASSLASLEALEINDTVISPELTLAQMRSLCKSSARVTVYGRLPLMLTEKCVGKELGSCNDCKDGKLSLTDRKGVSFPVRMRYGHRSLIFNSVPIYMADRKDELSRAGVTAEHFIFSTESKAEAAQVINAYKRSRVPKSNAIKRIK